MKIKYLLPILALFFLINIPSFAQNAPTYETVGDTMRIKYQNPEDTEFWLCFQRNFHQERDTIILELFISGNDDASVTIKIEGLNYTHNVFVPKGTVSVVRLPVNAEVRSEEIIEKLAVHIKSDKPISVYGLNRRKLTTDSYLGLPVSVLGYEYRVMCYTLADRFMSQFAVVATEDSTIVNMRLATNSTKHPANYPFQVILNKGEVYQVAANYERNSTCDLTGSYIKANKKISVFSGHQCAYVPLRFRACNHLVEQMPPISSWGKHFYIGKQLQRTAYVYRVLANEADTKIYEDNKYITTLGEGDYFEAESQNNIQLTATRPVLVAQYSMGTAAYKDSIGDPMMIMISPTQQFLKEYRFATPVNGFWRHYINLVVPTKAIHSIRLDGKPISSTEFKEMGISRYSIAHLEVPFGTHKIIGDLPFGLYSYGFGYHSDNCDAYGAMGGQSFMEYEEIPDTLAPMIESKISAGNINIIARDDRINDAGIKRIEGMMMENLNMVIPRFDAGSSQVQFYIEPINPTLSARGVVHIADVAANLAAYNVCYYFDTERDKYVFVFEQGTDIPQCIPKPPLQIGAFASVNKDFNLINKDDFFPNSGGEYKDNRMNNKTLGLYIGKQFFERWTFSATLAYTKYSGSSEILGKIDSVRDEYSNRLLPHQNSKLLFVKGDFLELNARAEYRIKNNLYGIMGLSMQFSPNMNLEIMDNVVIPEDFVFSENNQRTKLDTNPKFAKENASSFSAGGILGLGYSQSLGGGFSLYGEVSGRVAINSLLSTVPWRIVRAGVSLGVKYNL